MLAQYISSQDALRCASLRFAALPSYMPQLVECVVYMEFQSCRCLVQIVWRCSRRFGRQVHILATCAAIRWRGDACLHGSGKGQGGLAWLHHLPLPMASLGDSSHEQASGGPNSKLVNITVLLGIVLRGTVLLLHYFYKLLTSRALSP